jgi:hypothetical protein
VDADGRVYLLIENVILEDCKIDGDPYDYYYRAEIMSPDIRYQPVRKPLKQVVSRLFVGDEQFTMTYCPDPDKTYNRLCEDGQTMTVDDNSGVHTLSKEQFKELHQEFGKVMGFRPIGSRPIE